MTMGLRFFLGISCTAGIAGLVGGISTGHEAESPRCRAHMVHDAQSEDSGSHTFLPIPTQTQILPGGHAQTQDCCVDVVPCHAAAGTHEVVSV